MDIQYFQDVFIREFLLKQDLSENNQEVWKYLERCMGLNQKLNKT